MTIEGYDSAGSCNCQLVRTSIEELFELERECEQIFGTDMFSISAVGRDPVPFGRDIVPCPYLHSCGKAKRRIGQKRATRKCSRCKMPPLNLSGRAYFRLEANKLDDDNLMLLHAPYDCLL